MHLTRHGHPARTWKDVQTLIRKSSLSPDLAARGLKIFEILFQAEAKVHGVAFEEAHLHELAAVDCIVDIFGAVIGLARLGIEKNHCCPDQSRQRPGQDRPRHAARYRHRQRQTAARLCFLRIIRAVRTDHAYRCCNPCRTGCSQRAHASLPPRCNSAWSGNRDIDGQPNVLRLTCADSLQTADDIAPNTLTVLIETNIDDMNPQIYEDVMTKLFAAGALDVWLEQIVMKKSRPGTKLCVLADESMAAQMAERIFRKPLLSESACIRQNAFCSTGRSRRFDCRTELSASRPPALEKQS